MGTIDLETFTAFSVGESREATITTLGRILLPTSAAASEQGKYLVSARIDKSPKVSSLIERQFSATATMAWSALRLAGLNVPPSLYIRMATGRQYMTDVKQNGSEVYGRHLAAVLDEGWGGVRLHPRPEIDRLFLEILHTESQAADVWRTLEERVARATDAGIQLPTDDPFELIVSPNGNWDHISLDLELAELPSPNTLAARLLPGENNDTMERYRRRLEYLARVLPGTL